MGEEEADIGGGVDYDVVHTRLWWAENGLSLARFGGYAR
jgi:hypothetical protein